MGSRRRSRVPALAALATALAGLVNVASAMSPSLPHRVEALLALGPVAEAQLAHAIALPAGLGLLGAAWLLARRRHGAVLVAVALLAVAGVLDLLKGLDWEEALLSFVVAGALWRARADFTVRHDVARLGRACLQALAILGTAYAIALVAVLRAGAALTPDVGSAGDARRALDLLLLNAGGVHPSGAYAWLPRGLGLLGVVAAGLAAGRIFAPAPLRLVGDARDLLRAAGAVRRHGSDTLSAFKLRRDLGRRWSADGRAFAGARVDSGVLLLAGDPVGPPDALPGLLADLTADAHAHGLALGVVNASDAFAREARAQGLHTLYLGDEALLATGPMDLAGGARKSLRKAIGRVARHGYTAELVPAGELDAETLRRLDEVSARWRCGAAERGFSMAHDAVADELLPDALVVIARDADGVPRGFLHFMPVFGRPVVSLSFMRRDPETPNGLVEFLVARSAELLGERGIEEFSLNFAAFGRWLRDPANARERLMGRLMRVGDRWFQIERLHRFNAKFGPRWQPRHLVFDRPLALPRIALAALWVEGQLPRPSLPRRGAGATPEPAAAGPGTPPR